MPCNDMTIRIDQDRDESMLLAICRTWRSLCARGFLGSVMSAAILRSVTLSLGRVSRCGVLRFISVLSIERIFTSIKTKKMPYLRSSRTPRPDLGRFARPGEVLDR